MGTGNGSHQAVLEAVAHFGHPDSRHLPVHQYQVGGPAQADDGRNVLGATAPGPLLPASTEHRGQRHVADHQERTGALGTTELVARDADQVGPTTPLGQVQPGCALDGVGVEHGTGRPLGDQGGDLYHGVDHPGLVVGQHDRHQADVGHRVQRLGQGVEVDPATGVGRHHDPSRFPHGLQHCRMLCGGADGHACPPACSPAHSPVDRQVVGLGAAAGEHHATGVGSDKGGHGVAGVVDGPPCVAGQAVGSGRIARMVGQPRQHRLDHLGAGQGAGRMVKVHVLRGPLHRVEATGNAYRVARTGLGQVSDRSPTDG